MDLEDLEDLVITDQRLGEGGFGSVFICQLGGKKVAAKKLSQAEKEISNLVNEAARLKRLRHGKHIAYTYGFTMKDENLYMVMEYCERGDLQKYLITNKESATYEQKILFCRGILLGLLYCHSMNIFHGDIKCSNVILGENLEPKLADFGLSMTVDNIEGYCKTYEGSIHWAAPELFSIKEEGNFEKFKANPYPTDVYSLGATFCQVSFDGTTDFIDSDDIEMDISLGFVSPASKDEFLEKIVDKCCQFERNERISLDECLTLLDAVAEEQLQIPAIDDKRQRMQQDIKANSKLDLPPSFILHRPVKNLVVGPSNLSLLEWLCINNCADAVKYMLQLHNPEKKQLRWLYDISELCGSLNTTIFIQDKLQGKKLKPLALLYLIDQHPWQFIEAFTKAGANYNQDDLLDKAVERHYNKLVQFLFDNASTYRETVIHSAVKSRNVGAVRILARYVDLEFKDINGDTPLLAATSVENIEIVKILLDRKVNVHNKNSYSQHTPLYRAAVKGNHKIVELLISAGATIDTEGSEWYSLVPDLERQGKSAVIQLISNAMGKRENEAEENLSAVIPVSNDRGESDESVEATPLCTAIRNRQSDLVQKYIDDGADVNENGFDRYSPLHWAVIIGDEEIVKILLKAGADIDVMTPNQEQNFYTASFSKYLNGYTPLHIAIVKRHLGVAKLLIESGANFSLRNEAGQTIMEIADNDDKWRIESIIRECTPVTVDSFQWILEIMSMETVKTLINSRDASMDTLNHFLCISAHHGNVEAVNYLLENGTNVNSKYEEKSPLEWAISGGHAQIVQILIDKGADIHSEGNKKHNSKSVTMALENWSSGKKDKVDEVQNLSGSLLHQAAVLNNVEIVEILLDAGIDIDAKDNDGYSALYYAASHDCDEVVALLHDKGAKVRLWEKAEDSDAIYRTAKHIVHKAAEMEKVKTERIFTGAGVRVGFENESNSASPHAVILNRNGMTVESSLSNSALFNINLDEMTDLTEAVINNRLDQVRLLLDAGADINVKSAEGRTLLFKCVDRSLRDVAQFLIEKGADVNARDYNSCAPIHFVNTREIAEILISHGADINAKTTIGRTPLANCVDRSLRDVAQFLIEKGADVNARNINGYTPIYYVKNKEVAEILISHGADINTENAYGRTPLANCVDRSLRDVAQFLIEKGADVNARNIDGYTPIYYVKDKEVAEILITHGADINAKTTSGVTPLFGCVNKSLSNVAQFLIEKGADVNARNINGYTPIHCVNTKEIAEILISHGADINAKSTDGRTPLIECVNESLRDVAQFLIEKGADVNAGDKYGNTPIHYVKDKEIAEILISHGADINAKNTDGRTPLFECVNKSLRDVAQFLIEKGADVNARTEYGYTPIHCVNTKEVAEILISHGADINAKSTDGRTPLIECVNESLRDVAQFLIEKGADVNARDKYDNTLIHYVKDKEVAEILISHGADINAKNISDITPLAKCVRESNTEMVQFLAHKGADVNTKNIYGNALILFAMDKQIAEILIAHGADIKAKNNSGKTLFNILLKKQNSNLDNVTYKRKEVCELLEYLKDLK